MCVLATTHSLKYNVRQRNIHFGWREAKKGRKKINFK